MAWIPAAVSGILGITGMIDQNVQNKAAQKNNDNQQAAALANAEKQRAAAKADIAPFTAPGAAPFANRQVSAPGPSFASPGASAYGVQGPGQVNAASVMQGSPQQSQGQPPQQPQVNPQMMAMFMQWLHSAMAQQGGGTTPRQTMPIARASAPPMAPQPQPPVQVPPQQRMA